MAAPVLTRPATRTLIASLRPYLLAYAATLASLLLLAGAIAVFPGLRHVSHAIIPLDWRRAPHDPNKHTVTTAVGLWFHNARLALAPVAAAAAVQRHAGRLRRGVDLVLIAVLAANIVPVAVALGTWGERLLRFIPNAPVELLALIIGPVSWWMVTRGHLPVRSLWLTATVIVVLLAVAACLETWAVP